LWTDARHAPNAVPLPIKWIESLDEHAKVLVCVDGSRHITDLSAGIEAHWRLRESGKQVVVLLSDRGHDWLRSPTRQRLVRDRQHPDSHMTTLRPLDPREQQAIAELLSQSGLLHGRSTDAAVAALRTASDGSTTTPDKPYLLPTLMQLTDPHGRGFETILESVLTDLSQVHDRASLRLLLATALVHGADMGLPRAVATRLTGSRDILATALSALQAELQTQLSSAAQFATEDDDRYFLHHAVVADGLVSAAFHSTEHRETLLALCSDIPDSVRYDRDAQLRLPDDLFELVDSVPWHLDKGLHLYEAAEKFLMSWYATDTRRFPTLHRAAECATEWLRQELRRSPVNNDLVRELIRKARSAYGRSIAVAQEVLSSEEKPSWFVGYDLRAHEIRAFHGWAVLEGTAAEIEDHPAKRRSSLLRSVELSLLAFEPNDRRQSRLVCGTLALTLINLELYAEAARVTAASIAHWGNG